MLHQSNRDHRAVIEAILQGDGQKSFDLDAEQLRRAMALLTEILGRYKLSEF